MAASISMLSHQDDARKRRMEKAMQVMLLLNNDQPCNADKSDPKALVTSTTAKRTSIASQDPIRQRRTHRRGASTVSSQQILEYESAVTTPRSNARVSRRKSDSAPNTIVSASSSPRSALALSRSGSASTGSPGDCPSEPFPSPQSNGSSHHRPLVALAEAQRRRPKIRLECNGGDTSRSRAHAAAGSVALISPSNARRSGSGSGCGLNEQAAFEPLSQSSSVSVSAAAPKTLHHRSRSASASVSAIAGNGTVKAPRGPDTPSSPATPSPRDAALPRPAANLRTSASVGVAPSRRLRHHDTWHGESLDRVDMPSRRPGRSSHLESPRPREAPQPQLQQATTAYRAVRVEPGLHPSPRVPKGSATAYGLSKSQSDSVVTAFPDSRVRSRVAQRTPSDVAGAAGSRREMPTAASQAPDGRVSGPEASSSRRVRRPAALVIECDEEDDQDVGRIQLAPPRVREQREQKEERQQMRDEPNEQKCAASSPRFPCAIPSPQTIRTTDSSSLTARRHMPRQPGGDSAGQNPREQQRKGEDCQRSSGRQLSRFHTWGGTQLDEEPSPNTPTPAPLTPASAEPRLARGFAAPRRDRLRADKPRVRGAAADRVLPQSRSLQQAPPVVPPQLPFAHSPSLPHLPVDGEGGSSKPVEADRSCWLEEGEESRLTFAWVEEREEEEGEEERDEEAGEEQLVEAARECKRNVEGTRAVESNGGTNRGSLVSGMVKPKSKLQRSLSDDDEEEERLKRDEESALKQQGKKVPPAKSSGSKIRDGKGRSAVQIGQVKVKRISIM